MANKDPFLGVEKRLKQAGAELGQAQPELGLEVGIIYTTFYLSTNQST